MNDSAIKKTDRVAALSARVDLRAACLALALSLLMPETAHPQMDFYCAEDAARYSALLSYKQRATPEQVAAAYAENFTTKGADREAQAVWRRMVADGVDADVALSRHIEKYHSKKSAAERDKLRADTLAQITTIQLIHDLVLAFESADIDVRFMSEVVAASWRKQNWSPQQIDPYLAMMRSTAAEYERSGQPKDQAAVRSWVEVRARVDGDRGSPRSLIIGKGHKCFEGEVAKSEVWIRNEVLKRERPLSPEARADIESWPSGDPDRVSPLTYYTHNKFGPRDYSFDRRKAWQIAATAAGR